MRIVNLGCGHRLADAAAADWTQASPPARWADRTLVPDVPAALCTFRAEAFLNTHYVEGFMGVLAFHARDATGLRNVGLKLVHLPLNLVAVPYLKLSAAGYSERVRMTTEVLRDRDDPCCLDLQAVSRAAEDALPRWNRLARTSIAIVPKVWRDVTAFRLDGELTRLVTEARRDPGDLVHAHALTMDSTVCKGVKWIRTSTADGKVTIAAKPTRPVRDDVSRGDWTFSFRPAR
jgi:hypothetical protein